MSFEPIQSKSSAFLNFNVHAILCWKQTERGLDRNALVLACSVTDSPWVEKHFEKQRSKQAAVPDPTTMHHHVYVGITLSLNGSICRNVSVVQVLSDPNKRGIYDQFGHRGLLAGMELGMRHQSPEEFRAQFTRFMQVR